MVSWHGEPSRSLPLNKAEPAAQGQATQGRMVEEKKEGVFEDGGLFKPLNALL